MKLGGVVLKLGYLLRSHSWLGLSLSGWLGLFILLCGLAVAVRFRPITWPALPMIVVFILYVAFTTWARRQGYVRFIADAGTLLPGKELARPAPSPRQLVPVRASGWFTVEGREQYFVDVGADIRATGSGELIVMARVDPSRFLLLGRRPKADLGWWYLFLHPNAVREMQVGALHFGLRAPVAVRLVNTTGAEEARQVFLSSPDALALRWVWDGLIHSRDTTVQMA